jgi:hypothetical protein
VLPFVVDMIRNANDGFAALKFKRMAIETVAARSSAASPAQADDTASVGGRGGKGGKKFALAGSAASASASASTAKSSAKAASSSSAAFASASGGDSNGNDGDGSAGSAGGDDGRLESVATRVQYVEDLATHAIAYLSSVIAAHRDMCAPVFAATFGSLSLMLVRTCARVCGGVGVGF